VEDKVHQFLVFFRHLFGGKHSLFQFFAVNIDPFLFVEKFDRAESVPYFHFYLRVSLFFKKFNLFLSFLEVFFAYFLIVELKHFGKFHDGSELYISFSHSKKIGLNGISIVHSTEILLQIKDLIRLAVSLSLFFLYRTIYFFENDLLY